MKDSFLEALSSPESPVPGGGAAAAHAALVGLSLLRKIVGVERRRLRDNQEMGPFWESLSAKAANSVRLLYGLRDEDGKSYMRFSDTKSAGRSKAAISEAMAHVIECPVKIMETAGEAMETVLPAAEKCKSHLLSDLLVAAELLCAASTAACRIAQANLRSCDDPALKVEYGKRLAQTDALRRDALVRVEDVVRKRLNAR